MMTCKGIPYENYFKALRYMFKERCDVIEAETSKLKQLGVGDSKAAKNMALLKYLNKYKDE